MLAFTLPCTQGHRPAAVGQQELVQREDHAVRRRVLALELPAAHAQTPAEAAALFCGYDQLLMGTYVPWILQSAQRVIDTYVSTLFRSKAYFSLPATRAC